MRHSPLLHSLRRRPLGARIGTVGTEANLFAVLFVADLLHPSDGTAVQRLLNGDMRHRRGGRSPVPMLLAGRKPDHVAGPDFLDGSALALRPPTAGRDD